jgi:hypothetical protein
METLRLAIGQSSSDLVFIPLIAPILLRPFLNSYPSFLIYFLYYSSFHSLLLVFSFFLFISFHSCFLSPSSVCIPYLPSILPFLSLFSINLLIVIYFPLFICRSLHRNLGACRHHGAR